MTPEIKKSLETIADVARKPGVDQSERMGVDLSECLGAFIGIRRSAIGVMDEAAADTRPTIMQRLLECIEDEACMR